MLTERRKEFLRTVLSMYELQKEPVHYTQVAQVLGVSKWTAYDILTALAREGYLEIVHKLDRPEGLPGRSQVTFKPLPEAYRAVRLPDPGKSHKVDWEQTRKELFKRLAEADTKGPAVILRETLAELPHASNPLVFCAKLIVALLLAVWTVRKTAQALMLLREAMSYLSVSVPEAALILLVGLAMGYIWRSGRADTGNALNKHVARYVNEVQRMDERQKQELLSFVRELSARLIPSTA